MRRTIALVVVALAGSLALSQRQATAAVYLHDTFADNERNTESLPTSAKWILGNHQGAASLTGTPGNLVLDHDGFAAAITYYTDVNDPVTLAVGQTMTLSFDVAFSGGTDTTGGGAFRWALFNSGGNRQGSDFNSDQQPGLSMGQTFQNWRGYEGQSPIHTASSNFLVIRERDKADNGLFNSGGYTEITSTRNTPPSVTGNGQFHPASLVITRTASGVDVQATFAGASSNVFSDNASPVIAFDSVGLFALDSLTHDLTFDNIRIEVVPEPAAIGLLALAGPVLMARRRRD